MANYTGIDVGNYTDYQGASAYSTNSTGKLSFLNNMLGIYKGETGESGNFVLENGIGSSMIIIHMLLTSLI